MEPHQPRPWRLDARGQRLFDVLLATGLLLPVTVYPFYGDDGSLSAVLALGQLVPLYWRRHHAVAVFSVVALASAAQALLIDLPLWSQVAFPIATYSVARFSSPLPAAAALGVGVCASVVATIDWLRGIDAPLTAPSVVTYTVALSAVVATAWALGTLGRIRHAYVEALVERGERIAREADQRAELAASAERSRIAREMHDVVAHGLSVIVVQADGARYAAARDPGVATRALETIATTGRESLTEMRRLLGLLRAGEETGWRPQPGLAELACLVEDARAGGAEVEAALPEETTRVPEGVALTAYRVVQESLSNVRRHAGPSPHVRVSVTAGPELVVEVEDDGRGAGTADDHRGNGLVGMRERVTVHGGTFTAGPRPGGGFRVAARLPL
ncbi:sensor histidine kinase [Nocardioides sp. cx-173]|uniref:sensor histidine kinase n=1 Tax=Nocardioides sp. cx-173 TaxID=2898796 RepID=UPI001E4043C2|nr:sensor histidine kinase [Nocardioides sp. cx-173]MCD4523424.1 sensor histidine kinase [Nocardioides sp. cx-173]UGB42237.1 sensor histidine kinase [Nocardioides sp. cx-173]